MKEGHSWRVVEFGVNGKPFLWKKAGSRDYVMIDVFKVRPDGCYNVLALGANPLATDYVSGKVIGVGCAATRSDWIGAYKKARQIADRYMNRHIDRD